MRLEVVLGPNKMFAAAGSTRSHPGAYSAAQSSQLDFRRYGAMESMARKGKGGEGERLVSACRIWISEFDID